MLEALGQYRILERLGTGRAGDVYRARDSRAGRTVALRIVPSRIAGDTHRRDEFLRAARASAALSHPNIAAIYEIGDTADHLFLVSEYVPGNALATVSAGHPLNPRHAVDLAIQLADALAVAHAAMVVHGDIRPANIIITPKGNAKFLDFGFSSPAPAAAEHRHAASLDDGGQVRGDAAYQSPEQLSGEPEDHRADIFSLGVVLFEMLTGALPVAGATTSAAAAHSVQFPVRPTSATAAMRASELDAILLKMLAKNPGERYDSAATLAADLRTVAAVLAARSNEAASSGPARAAHPRAAAGRPRRPRAAFWMALALAVVVAGALLVGASGAGERLLSLLPRVWGRG